MFVTSNFGRRTGGTEMIGKAVSGYSELPIIDSCVILLYL